MIHGARRVAEFRFAGDVAQFLFRNPKQERGSFLRNHRILKRVETMRRGFRYEATESNLQ